MAKNKFPFESYLGLDKFRYVLPQPVKCGEVFRRHKRFVLKDAFADGKCHWQVGTRAPWRDLTFTVNFAPNRPARRGWVKQEVSNLPAKDLTPEFSEDGLSYTIIIPAPKLGTETFFHWEWAD